ncbi:MAG: GNAT family N-acetyltransferase [Bacteroidales bacterium]|nr:GNAT family N-acetyltransferase [Bacteroidales bacterium]
MFEKLDFRLLNSSDINLLFNFNSSIENLEFVPRTPFQTINEAEALLAKFLKSMAEQTAIWWVFSEMSTGKEIGYGGLFGIDKDNHKAEIGYGFLKESWGKGFASSAVNFITNYCFSELKLHRLNGLVDPQNKASIRVLEKNGYINEGIMRDYYYARDRYFDMCLLAKIIG